MTKKEKSLFDVYLALRVKYLVGKYYHSDASIEQQVVLDNAWSDFYREVGDVKRALDFFMDQTRQTFTYSDMKV